MATHRLCSIPDCNNPHLGRGWCRAHYKRWQKHGDPLAGQKSKQRGEARAFYENVVLRHDSDECLTWPFYVNPGGYGTLDDGGRPRIVSRLVCEYFEGPPPTPQHHAAHSCGKGHLGCVSRRHLRWATAKENMSDTHSHGTYLIGERKGGSKLNNTDVRRIRKLAPTMSQTAIAAEIGVSRRTIGFVLSGHVWSHVK